MHKITLAVGFAVGLLGVSAASAGHYTGHLDPVRAAVVQRRAEVPPDATGDLKKQAKRLDKLAELLAKDSSDFKGDLKVSKKAARYAVRKKLYIPSPIGEWLYKPFGQAFRGFWDDLTAMNTGYRARLSELGDSKHRRAVERKLDLYDYYVHSGPDLTIWGVAVKQLKALKKSNGVRRALDKAEKKAGS